MKFVFGVFLISSLLINNIEASIPKCSDCTVFATGKDGSLWGWEDDTFCRLSSRCSDSGSEKPKTTTVKKTTTVIKKTTTIKKDESSSTTHAPAATSANATEKTNEAGQTYCKGCSVTATGGDGSFWGWEDDKSCVINNELCKLTSVVPNKTTTPLQRGSDGVLICSTCEYTRIDEDTTTWSKENGEDCRVIGSRCGFNTTPHPWCGGCVVTGTGGDGALFGWENNASCLINEIECGFVEKPVNNTVGAKINNDSKVETESGTNSRYFINAYCIVATIAALLLA